MRILKRYKPICFFGTDLLVAKGYELALYDTRDDKIRPVATIPVGRLHSTGIRFRLVERLLRLGIQYGVALDDTTALICFDRTLHRISLDNGTVNAEFLLPRGRRPLAIHRIHGIGGFYNGHYFGEYFENNDLLPVHIYHRTQNAEWDTAFTFGAGEINHIHAVIPDPYFNHVWILTGDYDRASAIWIATNNFSSVVRAVSGEQQFRSSAAFPTPRGLLYATDSQFQANSIRLLEPAPGRKSPNNWQSRELHTLNGPGIYATSGQGRFYFSNSVEPAGMLSGNRLKDIAADIALKKPGAGNLSPESVIVAVDSTLQCHEIARHRKDRWPMGLFQFGNVQFPSGEQPGNTLVSFNVALKQNDMCTEIRTIT